MKADEEIKGYYFVGIGGIGMSALARYFIAAGYIVAGYDRTRTAITTALEESGCDILYSDNNEKLPSLFGSTGFKNNVIIVYTPAIPVESNILSFFRTNNYNIYKRSEILGKISENTDTIAVAGTHGKTTISTICSHLLKQSHVGCSAFLGGISRNYGTNLLIGKSRYTVMEADEFDRSFHRLNPLYAIISSLDADHLDIYGDHATMIAAYNEFCGKVKNNGTLIVNKAVRSKVVVPKGVSCYTYGLEGDADYAAVNIEACDGFFRFDLKAPDRLIENLRFGFPGRINLENATAAMAVALMTGVRVDELSGSLMTFKGVQRRFDIRVNSQSIIYIDDYAHHPEEIKACIRSVKDFYRGRKITGIFQPHLFSRTRDHAAGFAEALDELDEIVLLPIYPAREKPIPGVTAQIIFEKMKSENKRIISKERVIEMLDIKNTQVLLTIGAGDIDTLVKGIEDKINCELKR